jgi:hypothetical protein
MKAVCPACCSLGVPRPSSGRAARRKSDRAGARDRIGRIDGDFFGRSGQRQPDAVAGQFQVQVKDLKRDAYIAKGTLAGEKRSNNK